MGSKRAQTVSDHFSTASEEDTAAVFTEMQLDIFRNDSTIKAAWEHGNFGDDINEATFEDFAKVKDYIADTIFATDNTGGSNTSGSHGGSYDRPEVFQRNPTDDAYPSYVDVSPFFEEWTPPKMYAEPADIEMPGILQQYNTYEAPELELLDHTHKDYPVNYEDSGMLDSLEDMEPAHGNQWREVFGKDFFTETVKGKTKPTQFAKKALQQIGKKGSDSGYAELDKWLQVAHNDPDWKGASGFDLNSKADLDKFKEITKKYNYTLPEGPTW